jgi:hypothetical protein
MLAQDRAVRSYCSAPDIVWLKDAGQTIVLDQATGRSWALRGVQAAAWDLLVLGYSFEQATRLLALLADMTEEEAWASLSTMLQAWERFGILAMEKEKGRD